MNSPFLSALGLCKKAGALVRGRDETFSAVSAGKINTVFIAADISERSKKEVVNHLIEESLRVFNYNDVTNDYDSNVLIEQDFSKFKKV